MAKEKELTLTELADQIVELLEKNGGEVSPLRQHSVESHLRTAIRQLGYKPRETKDEPANALELASQLKAVLNELGGEAPEDAHDFVHAHLRSTHSNVTADGGIKTAPTLKDVPADAPGKKKNKAEKKTDETGKTESTGAATT